MSLKEDILDAASARSIPDGSSGLWYIKTLALTKPFFIHRDYGSGAGETIPPGLWKSLFRYTDATIHKGGELVMHDFPHEVRKHLQFALAARGRVLITGLGLGCVARMCLANPAVRHVVVIERDQDVLKLVGMHMPTKRLTIIKADAVEWVKKTDRKFDCAWHDLWSDPDKKEPHLQVTHTELIYRMAGKVGFQGAWELPRQYRRLFKEEAKVI